MKNTGIQNNQMKIKKQSLSNLEKLENNYRLIYVIIMSVPLIVALENVAFNTDSITGVWKLKDFGMFRIQDIVLFFVFLFTYARFFLGDIRYLDIKYLHHQNSHSYLRRLNSLSRFIDFYSLVFHAIFFYLLAGSIANFRQFYIIYAAILILNSVWLVINYVATNKTDKQRNEVRSSLKWATNNAVSFILFLLLVYVFQYSFDNAWLLLLFFILAFANTIIDYLLTWKLYFPEIHEV